MDFCDDYLHIGNYSSPRLSTTNVQSVVTIIDDEAGAGEFGFSTPNVTVDEEQSPLVGVVITRIGANVGTVSLHLFITDGRRDGSKRMSSVYRYFAITILSFLFHSGYCRNGL